VAEYARVSDLEESITLETDQNRNALFDDWAGNYDAGISGFQNTFPFDGYAEALEQVIRLAQPQKGMTVLDMGIGTGNLAAGFVERGCEVWGVDFSAQMLAKAARKLPQAHLVQADLLDELPGELQRTFDRIVSAYVLHEFDLPTKITLIHRMAERHLATGGRILIADIAFATVEERTQALERWFDLWDEDEYYWAADEALSACQKAGLQATYQQVSSCAGVFSIQFNNYP
jgi:putative AdoMet-dependent methyltransferase